MSQKQKFDLVIVGAGMVGASLVHCLRNAIESGLRVAMIDRQPVKFFDGVDASELPPSFDGRATAISYGSQQLLEKMDVWQRLKSTACPIEHIQVSDKGRFGQTHLHADESQVPAFGYVCANRDLGFGLLSNLPEALTVFAEETVKKVSMQGLGADTGEERSFANIELEGGLELEADLLVMADGGRSPLAEQLGIRHQKQSYGAHAIVTSIRMNQPHNFWAFERFTEAGPIALLPQCGKENAADEFAVVWTVAEDLVEETLQLSDEAFIQKLQKMVGYRAGKIQSVGERASYPLALTQASEQIRSHLVLLGNAAHALHPVAGQGFNLALRDTAMLAEKIQQAFKQQQPIGSLTLLNSYYQQQQHDQKNTIAASDWLPTIFSSQNSIIKAGRDAGLIAMLLTPTLRYLFSRHAMGLGHKAAKI